jgi:hypothetical protein
MSGVPEPQHFYGLNHLRCITTWKTVRCWRSIGCGDRLKFFDQLEAMDFDVMVPGRHSAPATKADGEIAKSYVTDVYNTVTRILGGDHQATAGRHCFYAEWDVGFR